MLCPAHPIFDQKTAVKMVQHRQNVVSTRDVLHKFSVDLPKKHGRGGQSALRFARLRLEKRHNYVRKVRHPYSNDVRKVRVEGDFVFSLVGDRKIMCLFHFVCCNDFAKLYRRTIRNKICFLMRCIL